MSRTLTTRPEARAEFDDGVDFVDAVRAGWGAEFTLAVNAVFARIAAMPALRGEVQPGVRKTRVPGYKYVVHYAFDDATVDVIAVFHTSRDPADWQRRV